VEVEAPAGKAPGIGRNDHVPSTDHALDQAALVEVEAAGNAPGLVEAIAAAEPLPSDQPLDNRELVEVEAAAG